MQSSEETIIVITTAIKNRKFDLEFYKNRRAQLLQQLDAVKERIEHEETEILKLANLPAKIKGDDHDDEHDTHTE